MVINYDNKSIKNENNILTPVDSIELLSECVFWVKKLTD